MTPNSERKRRHGAGIGHVHLAVSDLDRAVAFYRDALALSVSGCSKTSAYLAVGDYHHHIGLIVSGSGSTGAATAASPGPCVAALRLPTRVALAQAARRLQVCGVEVVGASDHGVNEALYIADPDGHGIALSWDRPRADWPRTANGEIAVVDLPLDLDSLLACGGDAARGGRRP